MEVSVLGNAEVRGYGISSGKRKTQGKRKVSAKSGNALELQIPLSTYHIPPAWGRPQGIEGWEAKKWRRSP